MTNEHPAIVSRFPQVPWRSMRGKRNRLTHGYFATDLGIVWRTVVTALPALIKELEKLETALKS